MRTRGSKLASTPSGMTVAIQTYRTVDTQTRNSTSDTILCDEQCRPCAVAKVPDDVVFIRST